MMPFIRFLLSTLFLLITAAPLLAALVDANWREDAKEFLAQGKPDAALYLVEQATETAMREPELARQVDYFRFAGELAWMANKYESAQQYFAKALSLALKEPAIWRRMSLVISVLELQQQVADIPSLRRELLHQTITHKLLPLTAADRHASDIGRYIQCFDGALSASLANELLRQIDLIALAPIRTRALLAMNKLVFDASAATPHLRIAENPPHNADAMEKFLWHRLASQLHAKAGNQFRQQHHLTQAKSLLPSLSSTHRTKAKELLSQ